MPSSPIGIYLHIPFCRKCCPYCDYVRQPLEGPVPESFVAALCREIGRFQGPRDAQSIFFGGGTPSLLSPRQLDSIIEALAGTFDLHDPEITLEANPDDMSDELTGAWRSLGINRVSVGIQSFSDPCLSYLGRRHDAACGRRAIETLQRRFDNWNLDLMYGMPPTEAWTQSLETTLAFHPPHISLYPLTYEPGTPFEKLAKQSVSDDVSWSLYRRAEELFSAWEHYEISNFARAGWECRHNLIYWRNESYAGFGPGAYSYIDARRMRNDPDCRRYPERPGRKTVCEMLSRREQKIETLIQHFRLRQGICERYYRDRFDSDLLEDFGGEIRLLEARGLLDRRDCRVFPTECGFYLNNEIGLALVDAEPRSDSSAKRMLDP